MSEHSESVSRDQSQEDNSVPDVQHGVAAEPDLLWPFTDNHYMIIEQEHVTEAVLIDYRFMDGTERQMRAVRNTIQRRKKPVDGEPFVTWEDCANVRFREVTGNSSPIRITFKPDGRDNWYWSAVGKDALDRKEFAPHQPTMRLAGLPDQYPPTEEHRAHILHEFGHALGLEHEHQSPAREGWIKLKDDVIIKHYEGDEDGAKRNVLDKVTAPTNYTRIDKKSIMLYKIPSDWQKIPWNKRSKKLLVNKKLSALDQAFIRLMYPPDLSEPKNTQPFLEAMITAGVDENTAGRMLNEFVANNGTLENRLTSVRDRFNIFKRNSLLLWRHNAVSRSIDPAVLKNSGAHGVIREVTKDKLFQGIVKNIVYHGVQQYGIPTKVSLPGSTPMEVMKMLGALAMYDDVGRSIKYYDSQFGERSDVSPSYESQNDIQGEKNPQNPNTVQLKPADWVERNAPNFFTAYVKKPVGERTITVSMPTHGMKAVFDSNEGSFDSNNQDVDAHGQLYFFQESNISAGKMAKWTPDWIVFYHDEWDMNNFTACFMAASDPNLSKTNLRSVNDIFEKVQWLPI